MSAVLLRPGMATVKPMLKSCKNLRFNALSALGFVDNLTLSKRGKGHFAEQVQH